MCGRFTGSSGKDVKPGETYEILTAGGGEHMRWGFKLDKRTLINARAETLTTRFGGAFSGGRCALEVRGFYEWSPDKQKYYYTAADGDGLLLCALHREEHADAPKFEQIGMFGFEPTDTTAERFVIITTAANSDVSPVHDRMPLIVPRSNVDDWLNDPRYARELLCAQMPRLSAMLCAR